MKLYGNLETKGKSTTRDETVSDGKVVFKGGSSGFYLDDCEDVQTGGAAEGDALTYTAATGVWGPGAGGGGLSTVTDGTNVYTDVSELNFSHTDFYLSSDLGGEPVVNTNFTSHRVKAFIAGHATIEGDTVDVDFTDPDVWNVGITHDPGGANPENFTITRAGIYLITLRVRFIETASSRAVDYDTASTPYALVHARTSTIRLNDSSTISQGSGAVPSGGSTNTSIAVEAQLEVGDDVKVTVFQENNVNNVSMNMDVTFTMREIRF
jgi:hypothetical protein